MTINKIPSQVVKSPLKPLNLKKVTGIVIHHMAHPTADIKTVEGWHISPPNNYSAIGYNYWVGFDGTIYEGRGLNVGAHTLGHNNYTIGIGFQGDYSKDVKMPLEQFNAGIDILDYIRAKMPSIVKIGGHKDYMATQCPGKYFPLDEMISQKKRGETQMIETAEQAIQKLVEKGIINSPGYWTSAYQVVNNLDTLLIKIANELNK